MTRDAALTCVAMLSGRCYFAVRRVLTRRVFRKPRRRFQTTHRDLIHLLSLVALRSRKVRFHTWREIKTRAILPLNHTKHRHHWHWVVYCGDARRPYVLDPDPDVYARTYGLRGLRARGLYIAIISKR